MSIDEAEFKNARLLPAFTTPPLLLSHDPWFKWSR
jgi:hypothetical protein